MSNSTVKTPKLRRTRRLTGFLAASWIAGAMSFSLSPVALALPPGGANAVDTEGTYATVSPRTVAPCESIHFKLTGFPAGSIVSIKFDDGLISGGDPSVQGQGVIHRQAVEANEVAEGDIDIPCDMPEGSHWLRFLTSVPLPGGEAGESKGYSTKGDSTFTVRATGSEGTTGTGQTLAGEEASEDGAAAAGGGAVIGGGADSGDAGDGNSVTRRTITRGGTSGSGEAASGAGSAAGNAAGGAAAGSTAGGTQKAGSNSVSGAGALKSSNEVLKAAGAGNSAEQGDGTVAETPGLITTAQSAANGAPVVGLAVGGAILIVGMAAVGAYLYVNAGARSSNSAVAAAAPAASYAETSYPGPAGQGQ
ncbi:hypothetical protein [Corynebacterium flavescens]|uniref:hypothetical protein n=1 Tax=Corynebacterium flavescens TaxID=28028 RepID=UPI003F92DF75